MPSSSNRKLLAIFAYPNRYFTKNSGWVPLKKRLQSSQVKRTPRDSKSESVGSCRFHIHLYILACVMSIEFTRDTDARQFNREFLPAQFPWNWCKCLLRNFVHSKIFNVTKYREVPVKYFTAHYACRNADLNLTLVTGTTNAFKLNQFIIEFWGVRLTCLDCK